MHESTNLKHKARRVLLPLLSFSPVVSHCPVRPDRTHTRTEGRMNGSATLDNQDAIVICFPVALTALSLPFTDVIMKPICDTLSHFKLVPPQNNCFMKELSVLVLVMRTTTIIITTTITITAPLSPSIITISRTIAVSLLLSPAPQ
ncbi:hypothetical protein E2C01_029798 [Portunus trituberculatus]|uniref:Uncharacterized protein n=1 Tax=Portunus trituberculatus TaxID=210409 RepID=A0A5B7ETW1_PORTR|nr:hypothetical protein [Portunus trituberculatus]